jgi:hypothetical protein
VGAERVGRPAAWLLVGAAVALAGCGSGSGARSGAVSIGQAGRIPASLVAAARPIGAGPRFRPPARSTSVPGHCSPTLGQRYGVHLELFAADRVVLLAPGIGVRQPQRRDGGRITQARCYGSLATIDPTGVVLVRPGSRPTVGDVFSAWGRPLRARRLLSFRSGGHVRAYVDGRRWRRTTPAAIPLRRHAEIVLEVGPYVPPHRSFTFRPGL